MLLLAWMAPSIATGYMNGSPALSAGAAAAAAVTGASMAAGGAAATVAATRLAAGTVGAVEKAGAHVAGGGSRGEDGRGGWRAVRRKCGGGRRRGRGSGEGCWRRGSWWHSRGRPERRRRGGRRPRAVFARGAEAFRERSAPKSKPVDGGVSNKEWSAAAGEDTKAQRAPMKMPTNEAFRVGDGGGDGPLVEMAPAGGRGGSSSSLRPRRTRTTNPRRQPRRRRPHRLRPPHRRRPHRRCRPPRRRRRFRRRSGPIRPVNTSCGSPPSRATARKPDEEHDHESPQ